MKIGIIEVCSKNHICMIENWIRIAEINDWEIIVYTIDEFKEEIDPDILKYKKLDIVTNSYKKMNIFFQYIEKNSNYIDYLVITSLQSYFLEFLFFKPKCKLHLSVHNANTWFVGSKIINLKTLIKKIVRSIYKKRVDAFIVNSESILNYIKCNTDVKKTIYVVPFSMKQKLIKNKNKNKRLSIVYPGIVSTLRKDYNLFLRLANEHKDYDFFLLGKLNYDEGGDEILNKIQSMNLKNIYYFDDYIHQQEYNFYMDKADILFSHINVNYINADYSEVYGESKDTGVSYLMIEYGLPLLVNKEFTNFIDLEEFTYLYDDYESLNKQMQQLSNKLISNSSLNQNFVNVRKKFSVELFSKKINNILIKE